MVASTQSNYSITQKILQIQTAPVEAGASIFKGAAVGFAIDGGLIMIEDYTGNEVSISNPQDAPSVNPTGGGSSGGALAVGTYCAAFTWSNGTQETKRSPFSLPFTVAAGDIPQLTMPATLPTGVTKYNVYLTDVTGETGTEVFYLAGTAPTLNFTIAASGALSPPTFNGLSVTFAGIAEVDSINTSGATGAMSVLYSPVATGFLGAITVNAANPLQSWLGKTAFWTDDHTVAMSSPNFIVAGVVISIDVTGSNGAVTIDTTTVQALSQVFPI